MKHKWHSTQFYLGKVNEDEVLITSEETIFYLDISLINIENRNLK